MCDQKLETIEHLLIQSSYSRQVWLEVLSTRALGSFSPSSSDGLRSWWERTLLSWPIVFRKSFRGIILLTLCSLWLERNRRIFHDRSLPERQLLKDIDEERKRWTTVGLLRE
ncbi:hypothetical protein BRADI_1g57831v3 [Brachypodium distachyon]|uniref:Uncharacterized protein n=1 Tax=Brachypodium distachyon TaxID=15368 RepID=A0A0Q3S7A0_BRADI|nr:hypothetical protein BRADI_1g57831v3 [Brachypodium distachyon]